MKVSKGRWWTYLIVAFYVGSQQSFEVAYNLFVGKPFTKIFQININSKLLITTITKDISVNRVLLTDDRAQ